MRLFYPQNRYLCQVTGTAQVALKDITNGLPWLVGCLSETDMPVDPWTMAPWPCLIASPVPPVRQIPKKYESEKPFFFGIGSRGHNWSLNRKWQDETIFQELDLILVDLEPNSRLFLSLWLIKLNEAFIIRLPSWNLVPKNVSMTFYD